MPKYGKYTGGQVEAIFNMLGGEEVLDGLLHGELKFVVRPVVTPAIEEMVLVTCQREGGSRCSVCHGQIADGDDICVHGHQVGLQYRVPA